MSWSARATPFDEDSPHYRPLPPIAAPTLPPQRYPRSDDRLTVYDEPAPSPRLHVPGFIRRKRSLSNASKLSHASGSTTSGASSIAGLSSPPSSPNPLDTSHRGKKRGFLGTFGRSASSRDELAVPSPFEHPALDTRVYRAPHGSSPGRPAPTAALPERPVMKLVDDEVLARRTSIDRRRMSLDRRASIDSVPSIAPSMLSSRSAASSSGLSAASRSMSSRRPMSIMSILSRASSTEGPDPSSRAAYIAPSGSAYEPALRPKKASLIGVSDDPFARLSLGVSTNDMHDFPRSPTPGSVSTMYAYAAPYRPSAGRTPTFGSPPSPVLSTSAPSYEPSLYAPSTGQRSTSGSTTRSSIRFPAPPPTIASGPSPYRTATTRSSRSTTSSSSTLTTDTRRRGGQAHALRSLEAGLDFLDLDDDDAAARATTVRSSSLAPPPSPPLPKAPAAHLRQARERAQTMTRRTQHSFIDWD